MKRLLLFLAVLPLLLTAQHQSNKLNFHLSRQLHSASAKANPMQMIELLVKGHPEQIKNLVTQMGGHFRYSKGDVCSVSLPLKNVNAFAQKSFVKRMEGFNSHILPMADTMVIRNNILPVHNGDSPLPQAYDGTDVIVGIVDSGIDYTHPDFQNDSGETRVLYIWDHHITSPNNPPQPYNYGEEWNKTQIDTGACTHDDNNSIHGTTVSGVAAGNGNCILKNKPLFDSLKTAGVVSSDFKGYRGVAYKSNLIVVAVDFSSNAPNRIADACDYIFTKAQALGKPCVINISVGDYFGSHDGKDLQAQMIDNLLDNTTGRSVVAAAGNEGHAKIHIKWQSNSPDTSFTWGKDGGNGIYFEIWGDTSSMKSFKFGIGADAVNPYSLRSMMPLKDINYYLQGYNKDSLMVDSNRLAYVEYFAEVVGSTYALYYYITADSTAYNYRFAAAGPGIFDMWSFDFYNDSLPVVTYPAVSKYRLPDQNQNIVSSFQCSDKVITVANYINRNSYLAYDNTIFTDNDETTNDLASYSSRGPTRDGRIKPDIAATGDFTFTAVPLPRRNDFIANAPKALAPGGYHIRAGGTSTSSPVVAGAVALYLQRYPNASYMDIKNALLGCAKQDMFTGNNLPDNKWGYGKLDAFNMIKSCNTSIAPTTTTAFTAIYPNPAQNEVMVQLFNQQKGVAEIYDAQGKLVYNTALNGFNHLNLEQLQNGLYVIKITTEQTIEKHSLIIQK